MITIGYLDPGTGTLIVQAVLGGAAGAAVLFKTKGRKLFRRNSGSEDAKAAADTDTGDAAVQPAPAD